MIDAAVDALDGVVPLLYFALVAARYSSALWESDVSQIEAIFRGGVFEPVGRVDLRDNQRAWLTVQPAGSDTAAVWLEAVRKLQQDIVKQNGGYLPDSTIDIAADRAR